MSREKKETEWVSAMKGQVAYVHVRSTMVSGRSWMNEVTVSAVSIFTSSFSHPDGATCDFLYSCNV